MSNIFGTQVVWPQDGTAGRIFFDGQSLRLECQAGQAEAIMAAILRAGIAKPLVAQRVEEKPPVDTDKLFQAMALAGVDPQEVISAIRRGEKVDFEALAAQVQDAVKNPPPPVQTHTVESETGETVRTEGYATIESSGKVTLNGSGLHQDGGMTVKSDEPVNDWDEEEEREPEKPEETIPPKMDTEQPGAKDKGKVALGPLTVHLKGLPNRPPNTSVGSLGLAKRAVTALEKAGKNTLVELLPMTAEQVSAMPGVGATTADQICTLILKLRREHAMTPEEVEAKRSAQQTPAPQHAPEAEESSIPDDVGETEAPENPDFKEGDDFEGNPILAVRDAQDGTRMIRTKSHAVSFQDGEEVGRVECEPEETTAKSVMDELDEDVVIADDEPEPDDEAPGSNQASPDDADYSMSDAVKRAALEAPGIYELTTALKDVDDSDIEKFVASHRADLECVKNGEVKDATDVAAAISTMRSIDL